jgi:hypothetical protein
MSGWLTRACNRKAATLADEGAARMNAMAPRWRAIMTVEERHYPDSPALRRYLDIRGYPSDRIFVGTLCAGVVVLTTALSGRLPEK